MLKDFLKKYTWKTINYDWIYGYQCKDYTNQYTKEVFWVESPKWNAEESWNKDWGSYFEKHINTPGFIPLPWDICIWNWKHCKYWHIWIVVEANINTMMISDQNSWTWNGDWKLNNAIRTHQYTYNNVIWFIRHITK
jgi:hypothetical protein